MRTLLPSSITEAKSLAENILNNSGVEFSFIGMSDTNGMSVYFNVNGLKVRFSDHSVTNSYRMANEICFSFQANEFSLNQSLLRLRFESGDKGVETGEIDYITSQGKVLKAFGFKQIK